MLYGTDLLEVLSGRRSFIQSLRIVMRVVRCNPKSVRSQDDSNSTAGDAMDMDEVMAKQQSEASHGGWMSFSWSLDGRDHERPEEHAYAGVATFKIVAVDGS